MRKYLDSFFIQLLGFFIIFILLAYDVLNLPLIVDETYYTLILDNPLRWMEHSFGHPPGWLLFNNFFFLLFGHSVTTIRLVALFSSALSLCLGFYFLRKHFNLITALVFTAGLTGHFFFIESFFLNSPVLLSCVTGLVSLVCLSRNEYRNYFILIIISISIRESALVFLAGSIFINRSKKNILYISYSLGLMILYYLWSYLGTKKLLLNPQLASRFKETKDVFTLTTYHFFDFYMHHFSHHTNKVLIFLFIISFLIIAIKRKFFNKIDLALIFAFITHSSFFALYTDRAIKNSYFSFASLLLFSSLVMYRISITERYKKFINRSLVVLSCFLIFTTARGILKDNYPKKAMLDEAKTVKKIDNYLKKRKNCLN